MDFEEFMMEMVADYYIAAMILNHGLHLRYEERRSHQSRPKYKVESFASLRSAYCEEYKKWARAQLAEMHHREQSLITPQDANNVHVCTTSLSHLDQITLMDLSPDEPTLGAYLLLRTLEPAILADGLYTLVEDHEGNGFIFSVLNMVCCDIKELEEIFPVGTIFALKEPCLAVSTTGRRYLRCDCPTDIVFVQRSLKYFHLTHDICWKKETAPLHYPASEFSTPKNLRAWIAFGIELYKKSKFLSAIQCFVRAQTDVPKSIDENSSRDLHLNMAASYFMSGWYELSIQFAKKVLQVDPTNRRAHLIAGSALYRLRKYVSSRDIFRPLLGLYPNCELTKMELQKAENRISETELGNHDIYHLYRERSRKVKGPIDCAEFVGPVKVVKSKGKGRRVVATQHLEPGTLLVVSKALATSWMHCSSSTSNIDAKDSEVHCNVELATLVADAIRKNPETVGSLVSDLYIGNKANRAKHSENPMQLFCDPDSKEEPIVNIDRLRLMLAVNSFEIGSERCPWMDYPGNQKSDVKQSGPSDRGLFALPSYFNHHCLPNAFYEVYNDVMVIRSIHPIKEGEEVYLSYWGAWLPYSKRKDLCQRYGFQCNCRLCVLDRLESQAIRTERWLHLEAFTKMIKPKIDRVSITWGIVKHLKTLTKEVKATYVKSERTELQVDLYNLYLWLGLAHHLKQKCKQEIPFYLSAIQVWGFEPDEILRSLDEHGAVVVGANSHLNPMVMFAIEVLIHAYHASGETDKANKWIRALIQFEHILTGGDLNVVKLKYTKIKDLL